ncbi:hypothetical protein LH20_15110 [Sphingopyxis sp. 113P3]|jgi:hypothetical protein|nr:hypothetical protein LH20_15110 [Sphingopyxis sp. 113P3]
MPTVSCIMRGAATLALGAVAATGCGSQSATGDSANATTPAKGDAMNAVALAQPAQTAPAAASQTALPIAQGLYIADYSRSCSAATELFFYDGRSIGYIQQALPGNNMNSPRDASVEMHTIRRTGTAARGSKEYEADLTGFTRIWLTDDIVSNAGFPIEARGVKPTREGEFVMREGSMSARQMEYDDTTYRKCALPQLSSQMQATVRQFRPQLASGAAPQASASAQTPGTVTSLPIEKGYWAIDMSCAQAIRQADPDGLPDDIPFEHLDEKIDYLGELAVKRYEALGGNRYRLHGRASYGNGEPIEVPSRTDIIVNSRTSFTATSNDSMGSSITRYTHCPTSQIPSAIREIFEG